MAAAVRGMHAHVIHGVSPILCITTASAHTSIFKLHVCTCVHHAHATAFLIECGGRVIHTAARTGLDSYRRPLVWSRCDGNGSVSGTAQIDNHMMHACQHQHQPWRQVQQLWALWAPRYTRCPDVSGLRQCMCACSLRKVCNTPLASLSRRN